MAPPLRPPPLEDAVLALLDVLELLEASAASSAEFLLCSRLLGILFPTMATQVPERLKRLGVKFEQNPHTIKE